MKPILLWPFLVAASIGLIIASNCMAGSIELTQGQEVYEEHCEDCHGIKAIGEDPQKPQGGFTSENEHIAPALNGTGHTYHHPHVYLFQQIKNRKINKSSPMPPFSDTLSDDEINAVIAYLQSLWPEDIRKRYNARFNK